MTYKEKLQIEHPEGVLNDGWCLGCPEDYGYEDNSHCDGDVPCGECRKCWDREITEKED